MIALKAVGFFRGVVQDHEFVDFDGPCECHDKRTIKSPTQIIRQVVETFASTRYQ